MKISPLFCVYLLEDAFLINIIFLHKNIYESFTPIYILNLSDFKIPTKKEKVEPSLYSLILE